MAEINAVGELVHTDMSRYTLTGLRVPSRDGNPGNENISLYARTSDGDGGTQITVDFTEQAFRDWLETMQEWVATWE